MSECPCIDSQNSTEQPTTNTTSTTNTYTSTITTPAITTTSILTETSTSEQVVEPSAVHILVIPHYVGDSFITSGDGSFKAKAYINVPADEYLFDTRSLLLNGKLHVFGGKDNPRKVAVLIGCEFKELPARLQEDRDIDSDALSLDGGSIGLICFGRDNQKSCELFNGTHSETTYSTKSTHRLGGLGMYKQHPATVGCRSQSHHEAEALTASGWSRLPDHPLGISAHNLVGLEDDSMLLIYGVKPQNNYQHGIWQLRDDVWSHIGDMIQATAFGSALKSGLSIYLAGGYPNGIQYTRVDLNAQDEFVNEEILGYSWQGFHPHLFEVSSSYCI